MKYLVFIVLLFLICACHVQVPSDFQPDFLSSAFKHNLKFKWTSLMDAKIMNNILYYYEADTQNKRCYFIIDSSLICRGKKIINMTETKQNEFIICNENIFLFFDNYSNSKHIYKFDVRNGKIELVKTVAKDSYLRGYRNLVLEEGWENNVSRVYSYQKDSLRVSVLPTIPPVVGRVKGTTFPMGYPIYSIYNDDLIIRGESATDFQNTVMIT